MDEWGCTISFFSYCRRAQGAELALEEAEARNEKPARWEHFAHDADMGVRGYGPTPGGAFEQAALAMTGVVAEPATVRPEMSIEIACEAPNLELLLVDWLNAIVFEMATRHILFGKFDVDIEGTRLRARAHGEPISRQRHAPAVEVKGATMTALEVVEDSPGHWRAQCVVDV
ncbi:MAG: archease [Hyphomicrobiaceae bacterium]|nr:MAG: archease [Hyphomicrobiaceae bacterium]